MQTQDLIQHTEQQIITYLLQHPEFFQRHAQVLAQVQLTSVTSPRTVSLQERQAEVLREKIRHLEERTREMITYGNQNLETVEKIHEWSCSLAAVVDPRSLPATICAGLSEIFDVPQVAVRVWQVAPSYMGLPFTHGVSEDARAFASSLTMPFCGPNMGFEPSAWLQDPEIVQSIALLPLRKTAEDTSTPAFGLLVLGSPDPLRFDATMGTDFLSRMAEQASAALHRLQVG